MRAVLKSRRECVGRPPGVKELASLSSRVGVFGAPFERIETAPVHFSRHFPDGGCGALPPFVWLSPVSTQQVAPWTSLSFIVDRCVHHTRSDLGGPLPQVGHMGLELHLAVMSTLTTHF
jgi:hypothetical protein